MTEYTNRQIKTSLEMVKEIMEFHLIEQVNEHGFCTIKGIVADGQEDVLVKNAKGQETVRVYLEETDASGAKKKTDIFCGFIHQLSVFQEGELYQFHLELISSSYILDMKKQSRSYQNKDMTYLQLIQGIVQAYSGGAVFDSVADGKTTDTVIVQYEETDWEFLKRLASHFHASIFPDCHFGEPKIYFGRRKQLEKGEMKSHSYSIRKQVGKYKKESANDYPDIRDQDAIEYQIESGDYHELSTQIMFNGNQFYINKSEGILTSGEFLFQYTVTTEGGMGQPKQYPNHICGVSLTGTVLKSVGDKIKVHLEIDEKQEEGTAWEFPYQTMYTAQGEGGWYCMPEPGDRVSIYFPGKEEREAVGTNSSRTGGVRDEKTQSPTIKYFRTIHGKEIRFTPEEIIITCIDEVDPDTGEEKRVKIILHQEEGITLETSEDITLRSQKGIRMEAEEALELHASDQITLQCKKGRIKMDRMIEIAGPDVRIN